ncbi:MAG TPA: serine hydrolase [Luteimonas sp.]|nr:serine hydrolase [Luteimonas sp.]
MRRRSLLFVSLIALSMTNAFATTPAETLVAERAQALLQREVNEVDPGAAVLVAMGDHVIFRGARGRADIELAVALEPQNVFRIGSITKTLTAATILKLVAVAQLSLDDRLSAFVPEYPNGKNISIAQLLDHTAGVSDAWGANPADEITMAGLVKAIGRQPPDFPPGADWRYSNSGYILLGAVIEKVTGKPWHAATRDLILTPLGMARTGYYGDTKLVQGRVEGYSVDDTGAIIRAPYASMAGPSAAGALSSTVDDLFRFMRALATGHVLPSSLYKQMTTAQKTSSGQTVSYGYGVMLGTVRGERVIEHNGGIDGFSSQLTYFPKQDVTVVVLANTDAGLPNPRSLAHRLGALAIGHPYSGFRDSTPDAKSLASLVGSYRVDPSSIRTLSVRDGKLFVRRDDGPERQLVTAEGGILYFPGDGTDYFRVLRDAQENVVALDFHVDGMEPARRELRIR